MVNKTILLISPESWGTNFVSKHHYANYLAKNNTVYFLNPPPTYSKNPFGSTSCYTRVVKHGLIVVNYINLLPRLNNLPKWLQKRVYHKQAKQIQANLGVAVFDIVWSFDPNRFFDQKIWKAEKYIYHTVDVHSDKAFEKDLAESSDLVLLSSELLRAKLENSARIILKNGHATDVDSLSQTSMESINIPGKNSIKAGLIANFNTNQDYDLFRQSALTNPTIDFIFIGPFESNNLGKTTNKIAQEISELSKLDNVFFVGPVHTTELKIWMEKFDINLVLYREDKRNIIINPHKIMGYLYVGNITISSFIYEYKDTDDELIKLVSENEKIPAVINETAKNLSHYNSPELKAMRRSFAEKNSYENKIAEIGEILYN